MSDPWIVPGDPRLGPPPECPHLSGTREYEEWWEAYFKLKLPLYRESGRREARTRLACEEAHYGHDFYNSDGRCPCGLFGINFRLLTDDQKWRNRRDLICPRARGPIYYLDCYFYGAVCGEDFPVNTYGPSTWDKIDWVRWKIGKNFDRTEVVTETKGQAPLGEEYWPWTKRPH